jgi:predicted MFS family arabinose efflux permease
MSVLAASYSVLGIVAYAGRLELWHVAAGCLISGFFWAIEIPVRRTMLMEVVGGTRIGQAMGLESSTQNLTRMLGPPLGGLFLEWLGMYGAYWMGALLCSGSALLIWSVAAGGKPAPGAISGNLFANIRDGLRYIRTDRIIQATLFCTIVVNLFGFSYITMVPVIGQSELGLTAFPIGLLMSAEGAGAFMGALLVAFFGVSRQFHRIYLYGSALYLAGVLGFSFAGTYPGAMIVLLVGGMGIAGFSSMQSALILSQAPPELRNRIMGVLAVCIGFGPLGVLNVGLLAYQFGPRTAIAIIGCLGLLCLTFAAFRWPELRAPRQQS